MRSPLAPTLAKFFMGHHEKIWLNEYEVVGPSFYRRYVDDIFAVFENKEVSFSFLEYLNIIHRNITFTKEFNVDGKLPFLDVLVDNQNTFTTSVYHKPNFRSFVPLGYKIRLIKILIERIYKI